MVLQGAHSLKQPARQGVWQCMRLPARVLPASSAGAGRGSPGSLARHTCAAALVGMLPLFELRLDSFIHKQQPTLSRSSYSHVDNEGVKALVDSICQRWCAIISGVWQGKGGRGGKGRISVCRQALECHRLWEGGVWC